MVDEYREQRIGTRELGSRWARIWPTLATQDKCVATVHPHLMWSADPEAFVNFGGCFFDEGADDLGGSLASGEDFAAGQVQGGNFRAAANEVHQAFSRKGVDYSTDASPVDGAGAHGAWLGAGVESVAGEPRGRELPADLGAGEALGVLGGIAFGRHGIIARGDYDLAVFIDDEGTERMSTMGAGCVGELDGLA